MGNTALNLPPQGGVGANDDNEEGNQAQGGQQDVSGREDAEKAVEGVEEDSDA